MPETIFGLSIVEAIIFVVALAIFYRVLYRIAWQATDIAMEMTPWVIGLVVVGVVLFIGLWLYRQGQWSMMQ